MTRSLSIINMHNLYPIIVRLPETLILADFKLLTVDNTPWYLLQDFFIQF